MLSRILRSPLSGIVRSPSRRGMAKQKKLPKCGMRVTIVGAAGRFGSTLGLLLKQSPLIDQLALMDVARHNCGVAMDLSHIDTRCKMQAYTGEDQTGEAMKGAHIVLVCVGEKRSQGQTLDELFRCNAATVQCVAEHFACSSPKAFLGVLSQPVNSLVPMISEVLKKRGVYNPKKVFGITCIDVVRATTFVAEEAKIAPNGVIVPVVGGNSRKTMVPILSQTKPCLKLNGEQICDITKLTRNSEDWVMTLKDGEGGAVLAPAYAAARFTTNLIRAINGEKDVTECAYVATDVIPGLSYCATPLELGPSGIVVCKLPRLGEHEKDYLLRAVCELKPQISQGEQFILKQEKKKCASNK